MLKNALFIENSPMLGALSSDSCLCLKSTALNKRFTYFSVSPLPISCFVLQSVAGWLRPGQGIDYKET